MPSPITILDLLVTKLRAESQSYHPGVEEAPVAVLWTDPEGGWRPLLPQLHVLLPELLELGDYLPEKRKGPVIWLKTALAGKIQGLDLPEDLTPIFYLPGIARHELRNADQCEPAIQPLAELLYRGVCWSHKNGRDWSVEAFFAAEEGLNLDLAQDEKTKLSLHSALGMIGQTSLSQLQGRRLTSADFDTLVIGDTARDLLTWIGHGEAVQTEWSDERWHAFRSRCQDEFKFDPSKEAPLYAAEKLGLREDAPWQRLWQRFSETPAIFTGVRERLDQAQPTHLMTFDPEPWPRNNEKQETALHAALCALANQPPLTARQKLSELEKEHAERRNWVWARLNESSLAMALEGLNTLGEKTRSAPSFSTLDDFSAWYAASGWKADGAVIDALQNIQDSHSSEAVIAAIRSVYQPWLEEVCLQFQQLAKDGVQSSPVVSVAKGECILFVDGLRLDLGQKLMTLLDELDYEPQFSTRLAALPSVTATAKPAVSPIADHVTGDKIPANFRPNDLAGKELTHARFLNLLKEAGIEKIDSDKPQAASESSRGWCETGRIDTRGHELGIELAQQIPGELSRVLELIERLFAAGWKKIQIVTDHGWLLLPGGLEKFTLPGYLVESRWSRCAAIKGESIPNTPTVVWHWNKNEHVAVAPGACSFRANVEYSHGGMSPQECVLPVIGISSKGSEMTSGTPQIVEVKWSGQRCRIQIENPQLGLKADLRLYGSDAGSSKCLTPKQVEPDGEVSLLVGDEGLEGKTLTLVLLTEDNQIIAKTDTVVGQN